ncbi:MAG: AraC family transcriptional regulator [Pyrinomonadaceae bacterium]
MTYYLREIQRIKNKCYANEAQIENVIKTRHFIEENLDKEVTLTMLSRARFTSKFHLQRLFKKYYGQTPKQYLAEKRIEKAKELLKNGSSVTETCFDVGFESPSSFCTFFKGRVGCTPSDFKKEQLSQSNG